MKSRSSSRFFRATLAVVLLVTQIGNLGCGQTPIQPLVHDSQQATQRGTVDRTPLNEEDPGEEGGGDGGGITFPPNWYGTVRTLPVGPDVTPEMVAQAVGQIEATQSAMGRFAERGYIRRADMDTVKTNEVSSVAFLFYQKPGYPIDQVLAVITVMTVRKEGVRRLCFQRVPFGQGFECGDYLTRWFETQVRGGIMCVGGQDSIAFISTPEDPAIVITADPPSEPLNINIPGPAPLVAMGYIDPTLPGGPTCASGWDYHYYEYDPSAGAWQYTCVPGYASWYATATRIGQASLLAGGYVTFWAAVGAATILVPAMWGNPVTWARVREAMVQGGIGGYGAYVWDQILNP